MACLSGKPHFVTDVSVRTGCLCDHVSIRLVLHWRCVCQSSFGLSDMSIRWVLFCHWNVCQASLGLEPSRDLMVKPCQTTQGHIRIWNWRACLTSIVVSLACLSDQHCFAADLYVRTVLLYHVRSVLLILFCNWHACLVLLCNWHVITVRSVTLILRCNWHACLN